MFLSRDHRLIGASWKFDVHRVDMLVLRALNFQGAIFRLLGISFIAVALFFYSHVFLAQNQITRLKNSNPKEPERTCCCWAQNREKLTKCGNGVSANPEQVFSLLDQSGVSNFAFSERKIEKKMSSVPANQHSVILPSML